MVTREYKCKKCGIIEDRVSIKSEVREYCQCGQKVHQIYGTKNEVMLFNGPGRGAISKRYAY